MKTDENRTDILTEFAKEVEGKYLRFLEAAEQRTVEQSKRKQLYELIVAIKFLLSNDEHEKLVTDVKNWFRFNMSQHMLFSGEDVEYSLEYISLKEKYRPLFDEEDSLRVLMKGRLKEIQNRNCS